MSLSTKFLEHSLRLGRRLTTTAQNASAGVEKASGAAANFGNPMDAGKILDAANQAVRENPAFSYIWKAGWAIAVAALGLGLQIYRMEGKIHNVEKGLNEKIHSVEGKIHNVEVQVSNVEKGLNDKIHNMEVKLKDELHAQLGQIRGELSSNLLAIRASMERSEDRLSAQIEKTNETLAQLFKKLP